MNVNLTVEDCLNMHKKGTCVVISNGNIIGFQEEIPEQTENQNGD